MKFVVVGGGTAGWISAYKIKKQIPHSEVVVIESSKIPIIGVGEGVTGKFTDLLNDPLMELDEFEFLSKTQSLPKYGILFSNWAKDSEKEFYSPIEGSITENLQFDIFLYNAILNDDNIAYASISGYYYEKNKVPWFVKEGQLHYIGGRAYHVDAYKVGEFFKEKSIAIGVTHIDAGVTEVIVSKNLIQSIKLDTDQTIIGDMYLDCSGFSKVLMSKLDNEWIDRTDHLPVNRTIIFKPETDDLTKKPYTVAKAMNNGWIFEIPTRYKIGRGYIYCDKFASKENILDELAAQYGDVSIVQELSFNAGTYKKFWVGNCIALGLSSGFLEPLQATSLHVTVCQLEKLTRDIVCVDNIDINDSYLKSDFNDYCFKLTSDLLDFIQATYSGGREDTEFWKFIKYNTKKSEKLEKVLHLAKTRLIRFQDFDVYNGAAGQAIWIYTLAGLGYFDKEIIKKILSAASIDLQQINVDYQIFKEQMKQSLENKLTCDELNNILHKGEELKLPLNKIY